MLAPVKTSGYRNGSGVNGNGRRRTAPRRRSSPHRAVAPAMRPELLPIVTVFRKPGGGIFHSWCRQPLEYQGRRAELELDFYCHRCLEHVAVPESIVERIPVGVMAHGEEALS